MKDSNEIAATAVLEPVMIESENGSGHHLNAAELPTAKFVSNEQLIAEGKTNKEIAALLFISSSTVETHRARIMEKLDVHSAAEIVLYAVRRGIIR